MFKQIFLLTDRVLYCLICAEFASNARIAQSVEQRIENPRVGGSIPPPGTIYFKAQFLNWAFLCLNKATSSQLCSKTIATINTPSGHPLANKPSFLTGLFCAQIKLVKVASKPLRLLTHAGGKLLKIDSAQALSITFIICVHILNRFAHSQVCPGVSIRTKIRYRLIFIAKIEAIVELNRMLYDDINWRVCLTLILYVAYCTVLFTLPITSASGF